MAPFPRNTKFGNELTHKYKAWNCTYPEIKSFELYLPRNTKLGTLLTQKYKAGAQNIKTVVWTFSELSGLNKWYIILPGTGIIYLV